ncbi:30S ribosomal protein S13 [archaeon]|nr:30S ribosomal protein S13 [archaeon]
MGQAPKKIKKERDFAERGAEKPREQQTKESQTEKKQIVRLLSTDIDGTLNIGNALMRIPGIGFGISNAVCRILDINKQLQLGELKPEQIKAIELSIGEMHKKLPGWLLNRRHDLETGLDKHIVGAELRCRQEMDIKLMKKIKCYKGMRHALGLPVRGQRTKAHFRKGSSVGVLKKAKGAASIGKKEK